MCIVNLFYGLMTRIVIVLHDRNPPEAGPCFCRTVFPNCIPKPPHPSIHSDYVALPSSLILNSLLAPVLSSTSACGAPAFSAGTGTEDAQSATAHTLKQGRAGSSGAAAPVATWQAFEDEGVAISHRQPVTYLTWHSKGDYFASVAPTGQLNMLSIILGIRP